MAAVLLGQSVRIRAGSFHACLIHGAHPVFEDDDGTLKIAVCGVANEPEDGADGDVLERDEVGSPCAGYICSVLEALRLITYYSSLRVTVSMDWMEMQGGSIVILESDGDKATARMLGALFLSLLYFLEPRSRPRRGGIRQRAEARGTGRPERIRAETKT